MKIESKVVKFILKRLVFIIPQLLGISLVAFFLIRLIPGNPAYLLLGSGANPESVAALSQRMGLDKPIIVQYFIFIKDIFRGDLGYSWFTSNPVLTDIIDRFPATLELITYSLIFIVLVALPVARATAIKGNKLTNKLVRGYGLMAGAFPDFWLALILIYIFYVKLKILPAPMGRLDLSIIPPERITGFYTIDSLIRLDFQAFLSSWTHLFMPVIALVIFNGGPILKMAQSTMLRVKKEEFIKFYGDNGMNPKRLDKYIYKNSLPPVITLIGFIYVYMLGGSVLVENIFGWGGLGQYAVQSIVNSDFAPLQAFIIVAATMSLVVYLVLDIVYYMIDPRIEI